MLVKHTSDNQRVWHFACMHAYISCYFSHQGMKEIRHLTTIFYRLSLYSMWSPLQTRASGGIEHRFSLWVLNRERWLVTKQHHAKNDTLERIHWVRAAIHSVLPFLYASPCFYSICTVRIGECRHLLYLTTIFWLGTTTFGNVHHWVKWEDNQILVLD